MTTSRSGAFLARSSKHTRAYACTQDFDPPDYEQGEEEGKMPLKAGFTHHPPDFIQELGGPPVQKSAGFGVRHAACCLV